MPSSNGLSIQYETIEEAEMRLGNTVVMYDGEPVYVTRITQSVPGDPKPDVFRVYAVPIPVDKKVKGPDEEFRKFISSKNFDFRTIPLGFINHPEHGLFYLSRVPIKQFKQGLCKATLTSAPLDRSGRHLQIADLIYEQCFADTIKGHYPAFRVAVDKIRRGDVDALAFSREFALRRDAELDDLLYLYFKRDRVGFMVSGYAVKLTSKTTCLKESLEEIGVEIAW